MAIRPQGMHDPDHIEALKREDATFGQRLGARLIDGVILTVGTVIIQLMLPPALDTVIGLIIGATYYTVFWSRGQSPGMRAIGIRMIRQGSGDSLSVGWAFVRYVGSIISALFFLLGFLWMLWDEDRQTWHDKMVSTAVVQA